MRAQRKIVIRKINKKKTAFAVEGQIKLLCKDWTKQIIEPGFVIVFRLFDFA
jgi:hypothetical protein